GVGRAADRDRLHGGILDRLLGVGAALGAELGGELGRSVGIDVGDPAQLSTGMGSDVATVDLANPAGADQSDFEHGFFRSASGGKYRLENSTWNLQYFFQLFKKAEWVFQRLEVILRR